MFKRGGRWWTKISYEGRIIQKSTGTGDKRLAQQIEAQIRTELVKGVYFEKRKGEYVTVSELMEIYSKKHSASAKGEIARRNEKFLVKKVLEHFGNLVLTGLSPHRIEEYIEVRRRDGRSNVTIHHELALLKHAFKLAMIKWDMIDRTPFDKVTLPNGDRKRTRFLTREEAGLVIKASPDWLRPIVIVALDTGLRISNILNLTWKQADTFSRVVQLEKTKNKKPVSIPMTDRVFDTLNELRKGSRVSLTYVFTHPSGEPFKRGGASSAFRKVCRKLGIGDFTFHGLRHTFCSWLAIEGANLADIASLAGHSDLTSTMRYSHLNHERKKEVMKRLEKAGQ